jgi:hypothetical protein
MPSKSEQLVAIDKEIARSQNFIEYMKTKLSPIELDAACNASENTN